MGTTCSKTNAATDHLFTSNDLSEFIAFFRLRGIEGFLSDNSVKTVTDLQFIYTSDEKLLEVQAAVDPQTYQRFLSAPLYATLLSGIDVAINNPKPKKRKPKSIAHEIDRVTRDFANTRAGIDITIMMDVTGSMTRYKENMEKHAENVVSKVKETHPNARIRVAFIGYRDVKDQGNLVVVDFTEDISAVQKEIKKEKPSGGTGYTADIAGALEKACTLSWSSETKIIFHACDTPCHGTDYHDPAKKIREPYPDGLPDGITRPASEDMLKQLRDRKVHYFFGRIIDHTDLMVQKFNSELKGDVPYIREVDVSNGSCLIDTVTQCVTDSSAGVLSTSLSYDCRDDPDNIEDTIQIDETKPNWNTISPLVAHMYESRTDVSYITEGSAAIPQGDPENVLGKEKQIEIQVAPRPFAKGKFKRAHWCRLDGKEKVIKFFTSNHKRGNIYSARKYLYAVNVAREYAKKYNMQREEEVPAIHFLDAKIVNIPSIKFGASEQTGSVAFGIVEDYLEGEW
eukprot:CAMPEP_0185026824 /NCGR_PEP_ID=MMETSP1103-20130426/11327_1 /TAXON_ID=36769 /ORGANISM="Paraphysomonas bandaiensis, Strain Caron Lab Isolate" /LENGTH=510 /DNA_ID=CAMNT_0027560539 /DNA_START=129 /DNA_END=1658 /DNA_ORIENTATION=+